MRFRDPRRFVELAMRLFGYAVADAGLRADPFRRDVFLRPGLLPAVGSFRLRARNGLPMRISLTYSDGE